MKYINPRILITLRSKVITSIFFIVLFSAYIYAFATPPGSPYTPGATLDPTCAPTTLNCYVGAISSQWVNNGSDIYYSSGKVGIGLSTPNGPLQVVELQYNTGTASQSGTTITGVGTTWTDLMIGSEFVFANGIKAMIIARSSNTSLTADISQSVSSQAYNIYYAGLTVNPGTGDVSIGSVRNPNSNSRLFVYGGSSGANVDARGNPGIFQDISQFEAEGNDYDTITNSIAIRYFGSTASGSNTIMGYDSNRLGVLDFVGNAVSLIRSNTSIQFGGGVSDLVSMTLDTTNRRLGIGVLAPTTTLDILGGALIDLNSSDNFTISDGTGVSRISMIGSNGLIGIGDTAGISNGDRLNIDPLGQVSYFTNTARNTHLGINNNTPGSVLDVGYNGFSYLTIDPENNTYMMGDINGLGNNSRLEISDNSKVVNLLVGSQGFYSTDLISRIGHQNGMLICDTPLPPAAALCNSLTIEENNDRAYFINSRNDIFVGINNTTPAVALDVSNASIDGNIFALRDSDGTCLYNPEAGSVIVSCSSDQRLKNNIINTTSALSYFSDFQIRDYNVIASGDRMTGVIAQEVLTIHPELVTQGSDGMYSVQLPNQWKVIRAIQELDIKIKDITTLTESDDTSFVAQLRGWFANAGNKITRIFTGEICLTDPDGTSECINKTQLHSLKQLLNNQNPPQGGGGSGDVTPPAPTDACPNIDGDQATVPDGMHLDLNNSCVANDITPPTDGSTPPADNPQP